VKKITILITLLVLYFPFSAQNNTETVGINLSREQMFEDFDQFFNIIRDFSNQPKLRKLVTGFDVLAELEALRPKIEYVESFGDFISILRIGTFLLLDTHARMIQSTNQSFFRLGQATIDTSAISTVFRNYLATRSNIGVGGMLMTFYHDGKYYNHFRYRFTNRYTNEEITLSNFRLVKYNGICVDDHIKNLLTTRRGFSWHIAWDNRHRKHFSKRFTIGNNSCFTAKYNERLYTICLDSVNQFIYGVFPREIRDSIANTWDPCDRNKRNDRWNVIYFEDYQVLYIYLSQMFPQEEGEELLQAIKEAGRGKTIEKIIIDVRDNRGGSDFMWHDLLSVIIKDTLKANVRLGFNYNENMRHVLKNNYVNITDDFSLYRTEYIDLLNNKKMFVLEVERAIAPNSNSLLHEGNIYIFQNEFSYSASTSFTAFARQFPQIISVGVPTGNISGFGVGPVVFQLNHSKYTFQMNIDIDLSVGQTPADLFQDTPEIVVFPTLEEQFFLINMFPPDSRYSECFLRNFDPLFRHIVIEQRHRWSD